jgi:hypothetical protein
VVGAEPLDFEGFGVVVVVHFRLFSADFAWLWFDDAMSQGSMGEDSGDFFLWIFVVVAFIGPGEPAPIPHICGMTGPTIPPRPQVFVFAPRTSHAYIILFHRNKSKRKVGGGGIIGGWWVFTVNSPKDIVSCETFSVQKKIESWPEVWE